MKDKENVNVSEINEDDKSEEKIVEEVKSDVKKWKLRKKKKKMMMMKIFKNN